MAVNVAAQSGYIVARASPAVHVAAQSGYIVMRQGAVHVAAQSGYIVITPPRRRSGMLIA